jgi:hypothetical protein
MLKEIEGLLSHYTWYKVHESQVPAAIIIMDSKLVFTDKLTEENETTTHRTYRRHRMYRTQVPKFVLSSVETNSSLYAFYALYLLAPQTQSMHSMCSMHGGFIFRNWGPSLKVHHCQHLASMTKHDTGGSPPGVACDSTEQPHGKT